MYLTKKSFERNSDSCIDEEAVYKLIEIITNLPEYPENGSSGGYLAVYCHDVRGCNSMVVKPYGDLANGWGNLLSDIDSLVSGNVERWSFSNVGSYHGCAVNLDSKDIFVGFYGFGDLKLDRAVAVNYAFHMGSWSGSVHGESGLPCYSPMWNQYANPEFLRKMADGDERFLAVTKAFSAWAIEKYSLFSVGENQKWIELNREI